MVGMELIARMVEGSYIRVEGGLGARVVEWTAVRFFLISVRLFIAACLQTVVRPSLATSYDVEHSGIICSYLGFFDWV